MQTISILGCGWLGFPLGQFLLQKGFRIKGSTTTPSKLPLLQAAGMIPYLINCTPESRETGDFFQCDRLIINLPPRNQNNQTDYHEKQLISIRDAATEQGVRHFLFVSSTAVYLPQQGALMEEQASEMATSRGGVSLLRMEKLFQLPDLQTTILRPGGLYGPAREPGRFLAGKKDLAGADNPVNLLHLDDCLAIIHLLITQDVWNETFNACSPYLPSRKTFYTTAALQLGLEPPTFSTQSLPYKKISSEKLIKTLGYRFIH